MLLVYIAGLCTIDFPAFASSMRSKSPKSRDCGDVPESKTLPRKSYCNIFEMALRGILSSCSSSKNSIMLHAGDFSSYGVEYERFMEFISTSPEPHKTELTYFIYPIFVQLYLELALNGSAKDHAHKFFVKHSVKFKRAEGYDQMVNQLLTITSLEDLKKHCYFKLFREEKYIVKMSRDCMDYLIVHLKMMHYRILVQMLNLYFSPESPKTEQYDEDDDDDDDTTHTDESFDDDEDEDDYLDTSLIVCDDPDVIQAALALKEAIANVSNGPVSLPSTCVYDIRQGSQSLSSVALSLNYSLLAGGFEESSIHVWDLSSDVCRSSGFEKFCNFSSECYDPQVEGHHVLVGHSGPVYGMSFTPQGEHLFSCSADTTVRAWDITSFKNVAVYSGHNYPVWDIDISPFALYFATASKDNTARLWTTDRMYPLHLFAGHTSDVNCVKFHPNCNYVATGSSDKTVRLWSVQDGRMVRLFFGHQADIHTIAFSPNGHQLASAGEDQKIKIWDIGSGSLIKELCDHNDIICSVCFSCDGNMLASCGHRSIKLWDTLEGTSSENSDHMSENNSSNLISSYQAKSLLQFISFSPKNVIMAVGVN